MNGTLHFHTPTGRWKVGDVELHCGHCFTIYDDENKNPLPVRIEHGTVNGWYLVTPYGICQPSRRSAEVQP